MNEQHQISTHERHALDQLGRNFDALLARTPERRRRSADRRVAFGSVVVAACLMLILAWAVWPSDTRFGVDTAIGSISEVAAVQTAPRPNQFVESESVVTTLAKKDAQTRILKGVALGDFYTVRVSQQAWLSMARPGAIRTRAYAAASGSGKSMIGVSRSNPMPNYRIAGKTYTPAQVAAFAKDPDALAAAIQEKVAKVPERFHAEMTWQYALEPLKAIAPPLPSAVRAELIRELESIPGVSDAVKRSDSRGREGLELKLAADGVTRSALFDPDTAQLLYTADTINEAGAGPFPDSKPGQVFTSYLLLSSRIVDSAPRVVSQTR